MTPARLGLFGGTFDPPHLGHLALVRACQAALALDAVQWIPCRLPALKADAAASARTRLTMTRLAIGDEPTWSVNDLELHRPGTTYTVETLETIAAQQPEAALWWLLGADALVDFPRWRAPRRIVELCRLAAVERPGTDPDRLRAALPDWVAAATDWVPMPPHEAASRDIRADAADGTLDSDDLPPAVRAYVVRHRLYGLGAPPAGPTPATSPAED